MFINEISTCILEQGFLSMYWLIKSTASAGLVLLGKSVLLWGNSCIINIPFNNMYIGLFV